MNTNLWKSAITAALIGIFFSAGTIKAQSYQAFMDSLIEAKHEQEAFEGVVLIAEQGEITYQKAIGYADRQSEIPHKIDTKFNIASITKSITAILIMQLIEENQLSLESTIEEVLPDLDIHKADVITVRDMLLHSSGLPVERDEVYATPISPVKLVEKVAADKKQYAKRGKFRYSNMDYCILGLMIEKLRDKSWEKVVTERIIQPLALSHTGFLKMNQSVEGLAKNYLENAEGKLYLEPSYYIENFYAAGCMYANALDLLKLDQALYTESLLSDQTKDLMYTSHPELGYVSFGNWTYNYPFVSAQPKLVERRGSILGANSVIIRFVEENRTLIILSNNDQFDPDSFGQTDHLKERILVKLGTS